MSVRAPAEALLTCTPQAGIVHVALGQHPAPAVLARVSVAPGEAAVQCLTVSPSTVWAPAGRGRILTRQRLGYHILGDGREGQRNENIHEQAALCATYGEKNKGSTEGSGTWLFNPERLPRLSAAWLSLGNSLETRVCPARHAHPGEGS